LLSLLSLHDAVRPRVISLASCIAIFLGEVISIIAPSRMATTFLPPIVPSPFSKSFARKQYTRPEEIYNYSSGFNACRLDSPNNSPQTPRKLSLPTTSTALHDTFHSNENFSAYNARATFAASRTGRSCSFNSPQLCGSRNGRLRLPEDILEFREKFPMFEDSPAMNGSGSEEQQCSAAANRSSDQSWNWPGQDSPGTSSGDQESDGHTASISPSRKPYKGNNFPSSTAGDKPSGGTAENFKRWANTFRHRRGRRKPLVLPELGQLRPNSETDTLLPLSAPRTWHGKRMSNASSWFVETVKTASLSNDSMSILPRSHRPSRISDSRAHRSSNPRSSMDSERPSSISSSDEGAMRRGIRRRQILQEILGSEEGYVADLKALINLFSTLLASLPSISKRTRNSIQQNLTEMLQVHERLLNELHRTALTATLRKSKPVTPARRRNINGGARWQSVDAAWSREILSNPNPGRTSTNFAGTHSPRHASCIADPSEVADVAQSFKGHLSRFWVYEDYAAKYEILSQDLANSHKMVQQWPYYEAGIEALAHSTASLNQQVNDSRKGLTAKDLIIKPVQRICRYRLLFEELHKSTPVVDCPSSHAEVDGALSNVREIVAGVNLAIDDPRSREKIQRRWLLQDRLKLGPDTLTESQFRMLGHVQLCGVLHVAYQTTAHVEGAYVLSMLFQDYLVVATPAAEHGKFDIVATIFLADAKELSTEDGKGTAAISYYSCLRFANWSFRVTMPYRPVLLESHIRSWQPTFRAPLQCMLRGRTAAMACRL
jgi:RhoGEF domain